MMFVLCISVIIYIFYFCYSLASLEYKSYVQYMLGRTITSASVKYSEKKQDADNLLTKFNTTDSHYGATLITGRLDCNLDSSQGFRGILQYGTGGVNYNVVSNVGVACSVKAPMILPSLITSKSTGPLTVTMESMTGSEISDDHCKCALGLDKTWSNCVSEGNSGTEVYIDNGC
jgi:hypothetical protein